MKTKLITIVTVLAMVVAMLSTVAMAYTPETLNTADAMNSLGLFLGRDGDYALDDILPRDEGITLVVRMIGKDEEANTEEYKNNIFTDVDDWAKGYVGYAYAAGITKGVSEADGIFDPDSPMADYMFLTFALRVLGYSDAGDEAAFAWDNPYELAVSAGLIANTDADTEFTRGDAVSIFWNALDAKLNNEEITLAEKLIADGVFTAEELEAARDINANGKCESTDVDTSEIAAPEDTTAESEESTDSEETIEDSSAESEESTDTEDTTAELEESTIPEDTTVESEETTVDTTIESEEESVDTEEDTVDSDEDTVDTEETEEDIYTGENDLPLA